jgi:LPS-assembly protein
VQRYQTLQPDPLNPVAIPYSLQPRLEASTRQEVASNLDGVLFYQYTSFQHPDPAVISAHRSVLYPQLVLPVVGASGFLTPKFGVHYTRYAFGDRPVGLRETFQRTVPISSVDAGLNFERDLRWFGRDLVQTLEPRLYYLYVPLRDQSFLTDNGVNFDSGISDFNFAQIFAENLFTGQDRIADANQVTAAVTSRFLDAEDGGERLKLSLGQRFYLDSQEVTLSSGDARRTDRKTDLLAAASGRLSAEVWLDSAVQYNPRDGRLERLNVGVRYQPGAARVLNAAYRFGRNQTAPFDVAIEQVDISGQWPLFGGWQAVGRYNYSLNENRVIETIAGLEYNSGCWSVRAVMQRYATTAIEATSAVFVQLELNDFSRIGSNPLELLKRSIPGYGRVDQPAADPVFGTQR